MIVLLTGLKNSGKDTIGDWLECGYNFNKMSFADTLKDVVSTLFNWDSKRLEGSNIQDRIWRETVDHKWSKLLKRNITPRMMLQEIGTDVIRNHFHNDMWILTAIQKLDSKLNYCFTDTRFPNEITKIKELFPNTIVINVIRPPTPSWYGNTDEAIKQGIHPSEYTMMNYNRLIDHTIINNKDILELCKWVDAIMESYNE